METTVEAAEGTGAASAPWLVLLLLADGNAVPT